MAKMDLFSRHIKTNFLAASRNQFPVNLCRVAIDSACALTCHGKSKGEGMNIDRVGAAEQRLIERMARARARGLSTPMRYALAVAAIVGAETVEWLVFGAWLGRPPATFFELFVAIIVSARFLGAGPGCLTAALATMDLAYDLSLNGSFDAERFFGIVATYVAIIIALCVDANSLRGLRARIRRSAAPWQPSTTGHHKPIQRQPIASPALAPQQL